MRYRYLDDFRRGISVFAIFSYGIAVLGTPQCPPLNAKCGLSSLLALSLTTRSSSPNTAVLPSPKRPTLSNSSSIWNARTHFNEFQ